LTLAVFSCVRCLRRTLTPTPLPEGEGLISLREGRMGAWRPGLLLILLLTGCITRPKPPPIPPSDALNNEGARLIWLHSHPE